VCCSLYIKLCFVGFNVTCMFEVYRTGMKLVYSMHYSFLHTHTFYLHDKRLATGI